MKYWPFALGGAGLVLVLLLVFGLMWGQRALAPADPAGESVLFEVSPGESLHPSSDLEHTGGTDC